MPFTITLLNSNEGIRLARLFQKQPTRLSARLPLGEAKNERLRLAKALAEQADKILRLAPDDTARLTLTVISSASLPKYGFLWLADRPGEIEPLSQPPHRFAGRVMASSLEFFQTLFDLAADLCASEALSRCLAQTEREAHQCVQRLSRARSDSDECQTGLLAEHARRQGLDRQAIRRAPPLPHAELKRREEMVRLARLETEAFIAAHALLGRALQRKNMSPAERQHEADGRRAYERAITGRI